jgi:hypothetical protein
MKKLFYQFSRRIDKDLFLLWFEKTNRYLVISESQKEIVDLFTKKNNRKQDKRRERSNK